MMKTLKGFLSKGQTSWNMILIGLLVLEFVIFGAATSDALYEDLSHIAWEDHIGPHATIAVSAHGTNDQLRNTNFIAETKGNEWQRSQLRGAEDAKLECAARHFEAISTSGNVVYGVAPDQQRSASGQAITFGGPVTAKQVALDGAK